jgi:uncharacterized membrane protein YeaQ/YmgE (transglycosylase-associated protein family)
MDLILWVLFGGIAAWIAAIVIGANRQILGSIFCGIAGAVFAGAAMQLIAGTGEDTLNYYSLLLAVAGSIFIVVLTAHRRPN